VADGSQGYSYSSENLLTRVVTPSWTVDLNYDPLGRHTGYWSLGNRQNASDGDQLIYLKKNNAFLSRTVFGPGIDEPLYYIDNQGRRIWTAADERGSIVATANAGGTATWAGRYDERDRSK
jgi:YD repeat-containing protein